METPQGFEPLFRSSPFLDLIGPLFGRGEGANLEVGMFVTEKQCNARGAVYGGVLATLADVALGYTMAFSVDPPHPLVTTNLTIDYVGTAAVGDWLQRSVDIQKQGRRLAFANCYISLDGNRIVRASAVFMVSGAMS